MDHAVDFLAALRAAQRLGAAPLTAARVEALAANLGLQLESLPALMAALQREGAVTLVWGGGVEVMPEKPGTTASQTIIVAAGGVAQVAGRDATMGDVNTRAAAAIGELGAALDRLRTLQSTLSGDAAQAAQIAESALAEATAARTPDDERRGRVAHALKALKGFLTYAPQIKDVADVVETASRLLGST